MSYKDSARPAIQIWAFENSPRELLSILPVDLTPDWVARVPRELSTDSILALMTCGLTSAGPFWQATTSEGATIITGRFQPSPFQ